jgi:membrane protease YdiL (CAAX protease family)
MSPSAPGPVPDPHILRNLLIATFVLVVLLIADTVILTVWSRDSRSDRPRLAPRWSLAHLFLGFQAWMLLTVALGVPIGILVFLILTRLERLAFDVAVATAWAALPILLIQNLAMAAVVLFFVRGLYREPVTEAGISGRHLGRGLALGTGVALVALPLSDLTERASAWWIARMMPASWEAGWREFQELTNIQRLLLEPLHSPLGLVALVLVVGIVAPLGEEIFFRGFAHRAFRARLGAVAGAAASAALFALVHVSPSSFVPIFLIGLLLAYLYERTGSLAAPFALHTVNNSFAVLAGYFSPDFTFWPFLSRPH